MKYTLCPPGPEPKRYTASSPEMVKLLMNSPDGNLTIDQRRYDLIPKPPVKTIEERMEELRRMANEEE